MRTRATAWRAAISTGRCYRRRSSSCRRRNSFSRRRPSRASTSRPRRMSPTRRRAPRPPVAVDRRAKDPLAALKGFLEASGLRVLVTAESAGRRETMSAYFAEYGLQPHPVGSFDEFLSSKERFLLGIAPLAHGFAAA